MPSGLATRVNFGNLLTDVTVESGEPIIVCGIVIANKTGSDVFVTLQNAAGTSIGEYAIRSHESIIDDALPWLADAGLVIDSTGITDVLVTTTVRYRPTG
jgi:hypothetical protein